MMYFFLWTSDSSSKSLYHCIIFSFAVIGATKLTFYIDLAVWDGPLLSTLQQVIHASLGRTHCDLADLVWDRKSQIDCTLLGKSLNFLEMFPETHKEGFFFSSYPLVDWVVLAAMKPLLEVEHPHGRAGVDVVVVEHTIHCYILPRSCHHFLWDVTHRCAHTHTKVFLYKAPSRNEDTLKKDKKRNECQK